MSGIKLKDDQYLKDLYDLKNNIFPTFVQEEKYATDIAWIDNPFKDAEKMKIIKFLAMENFPLKIFFYYSSLIREIEPMMREYVVRTPMTDDKINLIMIFSEIVVNHSSKDLRNIITAPFLKSFYVTNYQSSYELLFKINKENELPNETHEVIVYRSVQELEILLDYLLEHKELRTKINNNLIDNIRDNHKKLFERL